MIEMTVLTFLGVALLLSVNDWRSGIKISVLAGLLTDPVRKIVPGEPVYFSSLVLVLVLATMLGAKRRGVPLGLGPIHEMVPALRLPLSLFVIMVVAQAMHAFLLTGSVAVAVIGLVAYLAPIPGILLGYYYARSVADVTRFFKFYVIVAVLLASGIYADQLGFDWQILTAVGKDLIWYPTTGGAYRLVQGFFRSPEIAAWHIASAVIFLFIIVLSRRRVSGTTLITSAVLPFLLGALIFTGRRKGLVEIGLFLTVYLACLAFFRKGASKTAIALIVLAVGGFVFVSFFQSGANLGIQPYLQRGASIGSAEAARVPRMSIRALRWVIERNGLLGSGAGTGSQGAQHFGAGSSIVGGAAEGGVAKIVAELGLPGLVLFLWLGAIGVRHVWRIARLVSRGVGVQAGYTYGLIGFLFGNALTFTIGHQVFGDPLVLYLIGLAIGFLLAMPRLPERPIVIARMPSSREMEKTAMAPRP